MKQIGKLIPKELRTDTYTEQLKSQEWSNFSHRIRSERCNACAICRRTDVVTQVHHKYYDFKRRLWEYDDQEVMLVCDLCHASIHKELNEFRKYVMAWLRPEEFRLLNRALALAVSKYEPLTFVHALVEFVGSDDLVKRYAQSFGRDGPYRKDPRLESIYQATERDYAEGSRKE